LRLLVVGHSYVTAFAQEKYVSIKGLRPELELRLLVPPVSHELFGDYQAERHGEIQPDELVVTKRFGGKSHMSYLLNPLRVLSLLRRFDPHIVLIEEDPHSLVGFEIVSLVLLLRPSTKVVFFIWDNLGRRPRFLLGLLKRFLTAYAFARTSLVICGNVEAKSLLNRKGYTGSSVVVTQIGVKESMVERRRGAVPVIGFVGRLVPEKGVLLLLQALSALLELDWHALIVGAGPLEKELNTCWRAKLGGRLEVKSAVPHDQVDRVLQSIDIFVLPSYAVPGWKEQFGLTLVQAMMAGSACVGSDSGAIPEVLGAAGLIFRERDEAGLIQALRTLLESEERRTALATAARKRAREHYSTRAVGLKLLSAIDSVAPHVV